MAKQRAEFLPYAVTIGDGPDGELGQTVARFCHPGEAQYYAAEASATTGLQHCVRDTSQRGAPVLFTLAGTVRDPIASDKG